MSKHKKAVATSEDVRAADLHGQWRDTARGLRNVVEEYCLQKEWCEMLPNNSADKNRETAVLEEQKKSVLNHVAAYEQAQKCFNDYYSAHESECNIHSYDLISLSASEYVKRYIRGFKHWGRSV